MKDSGGLQQLAGDGGEGPVQPGGQGFQVGGVGYYPTSGSPFVHLDTGSVRAWPRMTTAQLQRVFPDGRTLFLGSSGTGAPRDGADATEPPR